MKRVVVTGIGLLTPVGNTKEEFWGNLTTGKHGIVGIKEANIFSIREDNLAVKVAANVKNFNPLDYGISRKETKRMDLYAQYALACAKQALDDCKSDFHDVDPYRVGVIVGSGIGGMRAWEYNHGNYILGGEKKVSPFSIPMLISNMAAGHIAIKTGFKGVNYAPVTACATSIHALGEAYKNIKHGYIDVCISGGAEATLTNFSMICFNNMKAVSKSDDPDHASMPFSADRNGFVMGEGGGILILEEYERAKARGAHIYAEIAGYGATADGYHITSPDPDGESAAHAMKLAMETAGIQPEQVGYINAHGTSTELNDKIETIAIKKALGEKVAYNVPVSSTKSMTGHLLGGAGAVETSACVFALENGVLPPTTGYEHADPECDLDYVPNTARKKHIEYALTNSMGFGGQNATLCLKRATI